MLAALARLPVPATVRGDAERLQDPWFLECFVNDVAEQICRSGLRDDVVTPLHGWIDRAIEMAVAPASVARDPTKLQAFQFKELVRIVSASLSVARDPRPPAPYAGIPPWRYGFETSLLGEVAGHLAPTRAGLLAGRLRGRELLRWLMAWETCNSTGPGDSWRVHRSTASFLLTEPNLVHTDFVWDRADPLGVHAMSGLERLAALGLLDWEWAEESNVVVYGFRLNDTGRSILPEVAAGSGPFASLAAAVSADQTDDLLQTTGARVSHGGSQTYSLVLLTRLVAHEIGNALAPVWAGVQELAATPQSRAIGPIESGLRRVQSFVDRLVRTSELGRAEATGFPLAAAVREALDALNGTVAERVSSNLDETVCIRAPRPTMVFAIRSVVENALQAGASRIEISLVSDGGRALLSVDDDGPGVPPDRRQAIFEAGRSWSGSGSGYGLALVRSLVEGELGGSVVCETSRLGGAQFVVRVPLDEGVP